MILNRLEDILICRVDLWTAVPVAASTLDIVVCRQRKQAEEAPRHTCYCLQRADCTYELPRYIFLCFQRYRKVPGVEEPTRIGCPPQRLFGGSPLASLLIRITANHHAVYGNHLPSMLEQSD